MPLSFSKSSSSDRRQVATDQAVNVQEGSYVKSDSQQTIGLASGAKLVGGKAIQAEGNLNVLGAGANTGLQVQKGANIQTLTVGDGGEGVKALTGTLEKTTSGLTSSLANAIGKLGEKDQLTATDGIASRNILFLVLGAFALVVVGIYLLRK